ncbi:MAG: c-type cytochrome [Actinobacteria bacterium]|nr:c-type cytochrome [Actinomycetota bacterium]
MRTRLLLGGCAALLALGVAACGEAGASKATSTAASVATAAPTTAAVAAGDAVEAGRQLAASSGCTACHSADGTAGVGPSWKAVFNHDVELESGTKVRADEAYLRESIVNPTAKVVKGYAAGVMPTVFGQQFNAEQLDQLIAYIRSLA